MIEEARALYAVSPADFVAERNRLVKELKATGRNEDAAAVAALRKPRVSEHALNLVAHGDPAVVRRFADSAAAATEAQAAAIGGGGAEALRAANRALRAVSAELIDAAVDRLAEHGRGGAGQRDEIEEVLRSLTSSAGREMLVAGVLGSAQVGADELFAGAPERAGSRPDKPASARTEQPRRATAGATGQAVRREEKAAETSRTRADAAQRRRLDAERTRATRAVREAESHQAAVERELDALRRRLADAERRVAEAETALGSARTAADAARADLASLGRS